MEVKRTQVTFTVTFIHEELKVVGLALIGRLKADQDIQLAREINQRLLEGRKRVLEEQVVWVNNALERTENLARADENGDPNAHGP